jgi:hypothetical protein
MLVDSPLNRAFEKGFLALRHVRHTLSEALRLQRLNIAFRFSFCIGAKENGAAQIALIIPTQVVSDINAFSSTE